MSWLRIKSEPLAELYEGAVELTYGTSIPGRLRLVCHAVREIRNRLPDQFTSTKGELTYHARIQQLRQLWSAHGLPLALDSKAGTLRLEEDPIGVAVPVVQALLSLFTDDQAVEGKNRERTWDMFAALTAEEPADREELEPIVHHWLAATEWFMQRAHKSGKPIDPADDAELPDRFAALEAALESMVGGFFYGCSGT